MPKFRVVVQATKPQMKSKVIEAMSLDEAVLEGYDRSNDWEGWDDYGDSPQFLDVRDDLSHPIGED